MQEQVCKTGDVYYVMNRKEFFVFFLQKRRISTILCRLCQKDDCYNCNRFNYIREQLEKNHFFEADPEQLRQPILWQVFEDFSKKSNNFDKNTYKFRIYIKRKVFSKFLVKKYDFINDKIIETFSFFLVCRKIMSNHQYEVFSPLSYDDFNKKKKIVQPFDYYS